MRLKMLHSTSPKSRPVAVISNHFLLASHSFETTRPHVCCNSTSRSTSGCKQNTKHQTPNQRWRLANDNDNEQRPSNERPRNGVTSNVFQRKNSVISNEDDSLCVEWVTSPTCFACHTKNRQNHWRCSDQEGIHGHIQQQHQQQNALDKQTWLSNAHCVVMRCGLIVSNGRLVDRNSGQTGCVWVHSNRFHLRLLTPKIVACVPGNFLSRIWWIAWRITNHSMQSILLTRHTHTCTSPPPLRRSAIW